MLDLTLIESIGHYVYIEASSPRVKGEVARLTSDRFKVSAGFNWCLRFWYHMYGNSVGSLKVKIKIYPFNPSRPYYRTLWTQQSNHGDVWLSDQVLLNSPNNFEVWMNDCFASLCLQLNMQADLPICRIFPFELTRFFSFVSLALLLKAWSQMYLDFQLGLVTPLSAG